MTYIVNKELWRDGPWQLEPDFAYIVYKNYPCVLIRNFFSGGWLGYIGIDPYSKYVTQNYNNDQDELTDLLEVHGGITFTSNGNEFYRKMLEYKLQDTLDEIKEDFRSYFWIGFDCNHYDDLAPGMKPIGKLFDGEEFLKDNKEVSSLLKSLFQRNRATYKDIEFVKSQLIHLVDQVIAINKEL